GSQEQEPVRLRPEALGDRAERAGQGLIFENASETGLDGFRQLSIPGHQSQGSARHGFFLLPHRLAGLEWAARVGTTLMDSQSDAPSKGVAVHDPATRPLALTRRPGIPLEGRSVFRPDQAFWVPVWTNGGWISLNSHSASSA